MIQASSKNAVGNSTSKPEASLGHFIFFFQKIKFDQRLTLGHIGLFNCLLAMYIESEFREPLEVYSHQVMAVAKISNPTTYYKYLHYLQDYGYLIYRPSFNKNKPSSISFVRDDNFG